MTDAEYEVWVRQHSATFSLNAQKLKETYAAWFDVFLLARYTLAELQEATTWIAAFDQPRFLTEHLGALQRRISIRRLAVAKANEEAEDAMNPPCPLCQGYGWVTVPKRISVVDGQWTSLIGATLPTAAVCCDCQAGCRIYASHTKPRLLDQKHKPPMRLFEYENHVPHWQQLMKRKEEELNARGRAWQAAKDAEAGRSRSADEIIARAAQDMASQRMAGKG